MWRVVEFLGKFGNILLFLFLELFSFIIIINVNSEHSKISQSFFLQVSGKLNQLNASITEYFSLGWENEKLQTENTGLKTRIQQLTNELNAWKSTAMKDSGFSLLPDSVIPSMGFYFMPCKAINNSTDHNYNYITLNKGARHGVVKDMGLVSPQGIAGRVIEVSTDYSLALSVLNQKFKQSAKLLRIQNVGTLSWDGMNPSFALLNYIPQTSGLHVGDTVVTSGYGSTFPENFMIGTVDNFDTHDQNGFYFIKVKLSTDLRSVGNLYFVGHHDKPQIDSLESIKDSDQ